MEKVLGPSPDIEDEEDMEMIRAYERGEFVPVRNLKLANKAFRYLAKRHLKENNLDRHGNKKDARINIRVPGAVVEKIKRMADDEGLPYQTLIASVLHKFAHGRLVSKTTAR